MPEAALLLDRLTSVLRSEQREAGLAHGLQPVHFGCLLFLSQANRYSDTPAGATEFLGATKGTVSQSLLLLERRNLIRRSPDPRDKRVAHLELTAEGRRVLDECWPSPRVREALASLPAQERTTLETSLLGFLTALQRAGGGRSFGVCSTCRLFERAGSGFRCGLTGERLVKKQTTKICREHQAA